MKRRLWPSWRYPKLEQAFVDNNLVPHMRGSSYIHASSGGRTLISPWETGSAHPGFLMIDSPQKNLGQGRDRDAEFADSVAVADFYKHLHDWPAGPGESAQIFVVDDVPPPLPTTTSSSASRDELTSHRTG